MKSAHSIPDGAGIAPGSLRRGLRISITASSLGMMWLAVALSMPFVMLLEALGASGVLLGISTTVRQIAIVGQIPGSLLMEWLPRRKLAWAILACIHRALLLAPAWLAWRHPQAPYTIKLIIAAVSASAVIESLGAPAWHSWMADLVPESWRGRFWGKRQAITNMAFMLALGFSGWLLDRYPTGNGANLNGFALLLTIASVFGVADILLHACVPEPAREPALPGRHWLARIVLPLRHPSFRNLAIAIGIWLFASTMAGAFNAVYLKRVFHVSYTGLSAMTICGAISIIVASIFTGYLIERIGARTFAVIMMCVAPLFSTGWFFVTARPIGLTIPFYGEIQTSQALLLTCAIALAASGMFGAVSVCHLSLLGALAPKRERTLAMAVHLCLVGLLTAGGPLIGGLIVDAFTRNPSSLMLMGGTRFNYIHMLHLLYAVIVWTLAVPFMMRVRARRDPLNIAEAFGRVILVNPLRFASGLYHAQVLGAAAPRKRRRRAAEALGAAGAEIAITDLIARLDDPVADVREAAAMALGRIGGQEAHAALLAKIEDPDNDLTLTALRALRIVPDARLARRLLPLLNDRETLVVREVVRTLGACGDPIAVGPLLELLHRTPQGLLVAITAETLGHLGDISAVYEVLPRFRTAATPFMRRALAAACGDLMGEPDGFYRILNREDSAFGSGVSRLLNRARTELLWPRRRLPLSERRTARALLAKLDRAYEGEALKEAAATSFNLALCLARNKYGVAWNGDITAFLQALDCRDSRFTVGAWYLAILNGAFVHMDTSGSLVHVRDRIEIILAVHLAASWIAEIDSPAHPPPPGALSLTSYWPPNKLETGADQP
ncbi:MAG: MFS transporter [Kiritimatiellae bacterium]|nr:MFS transporter [Kiritimatiellia bacterium]